MRHLDPKIQSGIWVVEGSEIEDVNGLYAFACYNIGCRGIVKISHEKKNKYFEIRNDSNNKENNNKNIIFKEYELVQQDSSSFYQSANMRNLSNDESTVLYKYKNNKLEYVLNSDKQT
eukprot:27874_1